MISLSSAEAVHVASSACAKKVVWLGKLFSDFIENGPNFTNGKCTTTDIYIVSTAAISLTKKAQSSEQSKPLETRLHHVRKLWKKRVVNIRCVGTQKQPVNILTKNVVGFFFKNILLLVNRPVYSVNILLESLISDEPKIKTYAIQRSGYTSNFVSSVTSGFVCKEIFWLESSWS